MNLHQFRQILIYTVLLPLVLLLLLALVMAWQFRRTLREQRSIDHTDRVAAQLNELERRVVDQETSLRGYELTHDPATLEVDDDEDVLPASGVLDGAGEALLRVLQNGADAVAIGRQVHRVQVAGHVQELIFVGRNSAAYFVGANHGGSHCTSARRITCFKRPPRGGSISCPC